MPNARRRAKILDLGFVDFARVEKNFIERGRYGANGPKDARHAGKAIDVVSAQAHSFRNKGHWPPK